MVGRSRYLHGGGGGGGVEPIALPADRDEVRVRKKRRVLDDIVILNERNTITICQARDGPKET